MVLSSLYGQSFMLQNEFAYNLNRYLNAIFGRTVKPREDILIALARKEFEYTITTTYLSLVHKKLHMSVCTPSTH